MKNLNKALLSVFITMCFFFLMGKVEASSFDCEYTYEKAVVTISYNYDSPLKYSVSYQKGNEKYKFDETSTAKNFENSNFVTKEGVTTCPNVKVKEKTYQSNTNVNVGTYKVTFELAPDSNGTIKGKMKNEKSDEKEKSQATTSNFKCNDKSADISMYWANGKLNIEYKGELLDNNDTCGPKIDSNITEKDFSNSCPKLYASWIYSNSVGTTDIGTCKKRLVVSKSPINNTDGSALSFESKTSIGTGETVYANGEFTGFSVVYADITCDALFGDVNTDGSPANWIHRAFNLIKYIAIIAVLVLSVVDFVKAVAAQNNDELQKAIRTSVKRLIFAVMIFFIPILVDFIMDILGLSCVIE